VSSFEEKTENLDIHLIQLLIDSKLREVSNCYVQILPKTTFKISVKDHSFILQCIRPMMYTVLNRAIHAKQLFILQGIDRITSGGFQ